MKKLILLIILELSLNEKLNAQSVISSSKLDNKVIRISTPKLYIPEEDTSTVIVEMGFNDAINKEKIEKINPNDIVSISLVYTKFKVSETFDQLALNQRRLEKLYSIVPALKKNEKIQWYWVEQTGCIEREKCLDYFHGFIIKLVNYSYFKEVELIDQYLKIYESGYVNTYMDTMSETTKKTIMAKKGYICECDTFEKKLKSKNRYAKIRDFDKKEKSKFCKLFKKEFKNNNLVEFSLILDKKGKLRFDSSGFIPEKNVKIIKFLEKNVKFSISRYEGSKIDSKLIFEISENNKNIEIFYQPILPNNFVFDNNSFVEKKMTYVNCKYFDTVKSRKLIYSKTDDIILKVLDRNKQWQNCLIATDVTGSMYPYLAQFQLWHKLNLKHSQNHHFIFFNDGDNSPDFSKNLGKVGGLYPIYTYSYDSLIKIMKTAMKNGNGGDGPENNIEAIIKGLKQFPNLKEVILIADNFATPRDLKLLSQVKIPIRLILCGTQNLGFNVEYLNMIRKNGGSIHTIEEDIYDLSKLAEGEIFNVGESAYTIKNGEIIAK